MWQITYVILQLSYKRYDISAPVDYFIGNLVFAMSPLHFDMVGVRFKPELFILYTKKNMVSLHQKSQIGKTMFFSYSIFVALEGTLFSLFVIVTMASVVTCGCCIMLTVDQPQCSL